MGRHAIGILALVLFAVAAGVWYRAPDDAFWQTVGADCGRIGSVLGLWWLAWDQARRVPRWLWFVVPLFLLVLVWRPRFALPAIPILVCVALLRLKWFNTTKTRR